MQRFVLLLALLLPACLLEEATPEDIAEGEIESAATIGTTITALTDGQPITVSGGGHSIKYFKLEVPSGFDHVTVTRSGYLSGSGQFYVRRNQLPSPTNYDCTGGIYQGCNINLPVAGTYYIAIYAGAGGYSNLTFRATHRNTYTPIASGYSETYWNQYGIDRKYKLSVPDNVSSVSFTYTLDPNDDGGLELVVKRNGFATDMNYDCIRYIDFYQSVFTATCTFSNPTPGTYYVALLGHNSKVVGTFSARYKLALVNAPIGSATN